jgi:hypothetical protein
MSNETAREEWSRIQGDEDAALRKQQKAAGSSHSPVVGPGPHGDHGTNMAVEAAIAGERERCASLVELWAANQPAAFGILLRRLANSMRAS